MNEKLIDVPVSANVAERSINPHLAGFERFPLDKRRKIADLLALYREKWDLQNIPVRNVVLGLQELVGTIGEVGRFSSVDEVISALREEV